MLIESGDLIPVQRIAADIPWTRRRIQILNCLHLGPVDFKTHVYDTNVGDIAPLSTYFNPEKWTETDLNCKFGIQASVDDISASPTPPAAGSCQNATISTLSVAGSESCKLKSASLIPRLLIVANGRKGGSLKARRSEAEDAIAGSHTNRMSIFGRPSSAFKPYQQIVGSEKPNENAFIWRQPPCDPSSRTASVSVSAMEPKGRNSAAATLKMELLRCPNSKELLAIFGFDGEESTAGSECGPCEAKYVRLRQVGSDSLFRPVSSIEAPSALNTVHGPRHQRAQPGKPIGVRSTPSSLRRVDTHRFLCSVSPIGQDECDVIPGSISRNIRKIAELDPWLLAPWSPLRPHLSPKEDHSFTWCGTDKFPPLSPPEDIFRSSPLKVYDVKEDIFELPRTFDKTRLARIRDYDQPLEITSMHLPGEP